MRYVQLLVHASKGEAQRNLSFGASVHWTHISNSQLIYIYIYTHIYLYIYIYINICRFFLELYWTKGSLRRVAIDERQKNFENIIHLEPLVGSSICSH